MKLSLTIGIIAGVLIDRFSVHKVLQQKNKELERTKGNFMVLGEWLTAHERGWSLEKELLKRNYKTVAIYGMGILGNHLYQELISTKITIKYIIDQKPIKGVYKSVICNIETKLEGIDAIIVTPVYQFEEIQKQIQRVNNVEMISLRELLS